MSNDIVTVEHSSLNITTMEAVLAGAAVEGPQSVTGERWYSLVKALYRDVLIAHEKEAHAALMGADNDPPPWAEQFPDFLPRHEEMPDAPRAKAIVNAHGGKVVLAEDIITVRGLGNIRPDAVQPFMDQMVRDGWARVTGRANGTPNAWAIYGATDKNRRTGVPSDGITFHLCEHHGGQRVNLQTAFETLNKAAMAHDLGNARSRLDAAVMQGWATRAGDGASMSLWDIKKADIVYAKKEQP